MSHLKTILNREYEGISRGTQCFAGQGTGTTALRGTEWFTHLSNVEACCIFLLLPSGVGCNEGYPFNAKADEHRNEQDGTAAK